MWEYWRSHNLPNWLSEDDRRSVAAAVQGQIRTRSPTELRRMLSSCVSFKDLSLHLDEVLRTEPPDSNGSMDASALTHAVSIDGSCLPGCEKKKLVIIMVGLPGRGKTFLCNKLKCYLNWLGHTTGHFNVGQYRRRMKGDGEVQDADFFDHNNKAGRTAREQAVHAALADLSKYLDSDQGQVAIFDATNSTNERREMLIKHFHGRWQYLFIESICNDMTVLQNNYLNKMKYSPDYTSVGTKEQALRDFQNRINNYEEVYETITSRNIHYIKLIDMVTGHGYMDINRISGYIPGKIVFFLMQVCRVGTTCHGRKIWLTRHGESLFNVKGVIGGDSNISELGEQYALRLRDTLMERLPQQSDGYVPLSVWTSTLRRTIQTARHLPFPKLRWKALDEIDAGSCDGLTYQQISEKHPTEYAARRADKLRYRYPRGESYLDVIQRLEPVITEMERERECILVVAHTAVIRALYGYFTSKPQAEIPNIPVPLHTLVELTPMPDGTMAVQHIRIGPDATPEAALHGSKSTDDVRQLQPHPSPAPPLSARPSLATLVEPRVEFPEDDALSPTAMPTPFCQGPCA